MYKWDGEAPGSLALPPTNPHHNGFSNLFWEPPAFHLRQQDPDFVVRMVQVSYCSHELRDIVPCVHDFVKPFDCMEMVSVITV